jgi:hypothetical protein
MGFFCCLNPLLFASCTDTFSKWCKITSINGGGEKSRMLFVILTAIVYVVMEAELQTPSDK